jgi:hypothetical protein
MMDLPTSEPEPRIIKGRYFIRTVFSFRFSVFG